ncbi:hypothetical protein LBSG162_06710 [Lentilactobacillus buchneri subsp. silagei]|nr:PTS sugar transporter subunit IIC [Lentilactobacillus buchneri]BEJ52809.1 hypothetical protein Ltb232_09850 [Lentilactobacillus buchneri subsp. silagei]GED91566.1 hypothetical protein LBSG162_06710 [Lentilactobacillus buchneri subsp. silagei]
MFAVLIITPISTVAIGMAIQLNGVFVDTAAIGVAVITIVLTIHSLKTDKSGVTIAVALGSMKLMIPNPFCHPIILLLVLLILFQSPCSTLSAFQPPPALG